MALFSKTRRSQSWPFDCRYCTLDELFKGLETSERGLSGSEAASRLSVFGPNEPARKRKRTIFLLFFAKIANPLIIVLFIIAGFSFFFGETTSAFLVLAMALLSILLSFFQEIRAGLEAEKLSEMVHATATVLRSSRRKEIKMREIVPGDVLELAAGDLIPADIRLLSCKDLFVNQAALSGESMPQEKFASPGDLADDLRAHHLAFMGSTVISGSGTAVVIHTGLNTRFGEMSKRIAAQRGVTEFDRGIGRFTWMMIRTMLLMSAVIFAINALLKGILLESFLFSLAVAVGLTPEMLPMLITLNLSKGAIAMSKKSVIVKRLNSIQNFGAMDVLCTDKTGTLTRDQIILEKHCDVLGRNDEGVLRLAYLNSSYQTGLRNLLDAAILKHEHLAIKQVRKADEIPFDFSRRLMSVVIEENGMQKIITKGAPEEIFQRCSHYELDGELLEMERLVEADLKQEYDRLSADGFRVLAVAYKNQPHPKIAYSKDDERELVLMGYLAFLDPPKPSSRRAIEVLQRYGVQVKVLTGDNDLVAKKISAEVGLNVDRILTGPEVDRLSDSELATLATEVTVFARMDPLQKERVIKILKANGRVVGFLGDGINDAPSFKAADVGISVDNAVDIAKESADIILLRKSLMVLQDGLIEGRKTFANIIKYVRMGSSSNFGNMLSMTGASLLLPFLPMLPIQILLNNFLYDISQIGVPMDNVEPGTVMKPKRWDVASIRRFMVYFGPVSSAFDFLTFAILFFVFRGNPSIFRTGWFLESLFTQTIVIHVIRSSRTPFLESSPSLVLLATTAAVVSFGLVFPFTPLARYFQFVEPPASLLVIIFFLVAGYLVTVQLTKRWYVRRYGYD